MINNAKKNTYLFKISDKPLIDHHQAPGALIDPWISTHIIYIKILKKSLKILEKKKKSTNPCQIYLGN